MNDEHLIEEHESEQPVGISLLPTPPTPQPQPQPIATQPEPTPFRGDPGTVLRSLYGKHYQDYARQVARQYGIPEDLFLAYFELESGWNPLAVNKRSGAAGLGQIMPRNPWAAKMGVVGERRFDPFANINAIAYEVVDKYRKHGDWLKAFMYTGEGTKDYLNKLLSRVGRLSKEVQKTTDPQTAEEIYQEIQRIEKELEFLERYLPKPGFVERISKMATELGGKAVEGAKAVAGAVGKAAGAVGEAVESVAGKLPGPVVETAAKMVTGPVQFPLTTEFAKRLWQGAKGTSIIDAFKKNIDEVSQSLQQPIGEVRPDVPEAALVEGGFGEAFAQTAFFPVSVLRDTFVQFVENAFPESKKEVAPWLPYYFGEGEVPEHFYEQPPALFRRSLSKLSGDALEMLAVGPYFKALSEVPAAVEAVTRQFPKLASTGISRQRVLKAIGAFERPRPTGPLATAAAERQAVVEAFEARSYPTEPLERKLTPTKLEPYLAADRREKQAIIAAAGEPETPGRLRMEDVLAADRRAKQEAIERMAKLLDEAESTGGAAVPKESVDEVLEAARAATPEKVAATHEAAPSKEKLMRSVERMKLADEELAKFAAEIGEDYKSQLPRWFRELGDFLGDESGWVGVRKPLPPQPVIANEIRSLIETGTDPKVALMEVSARLGRSPSKVLRYLEEASPAEVYTIGNAQAAALDQVVSPKLKEWVEVMAPSQRITVDAVPKPFQFGPGAIDPKVPAPTRDLPRYEEFFASPSLWMNRVFGGSNNPAIDAFTGYLTFYNNRVNYEGWLKQLLRTVPGLHEDTVRSLKAFKEEVGPIFNKFASYLESVGFNPAKGDPTLKAIHQELDDAVRSLAVRYSNIRIKKAAEGEKWALDLCTPEERKIAQLTRQYYDLKKEQLKRQRVPVIEKDYVNHIFLEGGDDLGAVWWPGKDYHTPDLLKFLSRDPGARDWFPLWFQSLGSYIPIVEKKLAFNPVLQKWMGALDTFPRNVRAGVQRFFDSILAPHPQTIVDEALNALTNSAYFVTTFGNVAIPTLHLFKLLQTPIWHGGIETARGFKHLLKAFAANTPEGQFVRQYVKLNQLMTTLEQQLGYKGFLQPNYWRKRLGKQLAGGAKSLSYGPTVLVEAYDNMVNALTTLSRGLRAGVEMGLIHREILDSMLRLNFRSFDAPRLFREYRGLGRLLMMFQLTPYKLVENKADLIIRALTGKRDAFGGSDFNKLVRMLVYLGLPYAIAQHYGYDLSKHLIHPPFMAVSHLTGKWSPTVPPPVQLWAEMGKEGLEPLATSLPWTVSAPTKWIRTSQDDIPPIYHGPASYLLGVPKAGWAEELRFKRELQKHRKWLRTHRPEKRTPPLVDWLEDLIE